MHKHLLRKIAGFILLTSIFISFVPPLTAQNVAVTDDDSYTASSSAMLDVKSTTKGMLIPRLTEAQRLEIVTPTTGLVVYDITYNSFYYYNGSVWVSIPQVNRTGGVGIALFAVLNSLGDTVFAVYDDGAKIIVPEGAKGTVGGFAVSGRTSTKAGETIEDYFKVTPDSTRVTVNAPAKGSVGGFAVSGRTSSKLGNEDYLIITPDSTRIYVNDTATVKGKVGGFAVSGRTSAKATPINFLDLTPKNYFIGHSSGLKTTGNFNSFIGYESGKNNTTGYNNTFFGYNAGYSNTSGYSNILIGYKAGYSTTGGRHNVFIGADAGSSSTSTEYNIFIGTGAGQHNTTTGYLTMIGINSGHYTLSGTGNCFLGTNSGHYFENGSGNTFIGTDAGRGGADGSFNPSAPASTNNTIVGYLAGYNIEGGDNNVFLGTTSGRAIVGGSNNVFIGRNSAFFNTSGVGNVFLGYSAGYYETGSDKLYIENSDATASGALIYGDFSSDILRFNANVGIGKAASYKLDVAGDVNLSSGYNFKINGVNIGNQWGVSGSDIYFNTGNVAIGTTPDASYKLKVNGNTTVAGTLSATTFSGPLTGNVSGNVTGNLTGNVTGDVNTISLGKFNIDGNSLIVSISDGEYSLHWDATNNQINFLNSSHGNAMFWWKGVEGTSLVGESVIIVSSGEYSIKVMDDSYGYEVHFGDADKGASYCSVWLQYFHGRIVGHYTKY